MSEANLYAPPKTKVEAEPKLGTHDAYRDGAYLLAKSGYRSSRKCVATGAIVNFAADPVRIYIGPKYKLKSIFSFAGVFTLGALIYVYYLTQRLDDIIFRSGTYFAVLIVGVFLMRSYRDYIEVYYCESIVKDRKRREHFKTALFMIGIGIMYFCDKFSSSIYIAIGFIVFSYLIFPKSYLKKQGVSGEYQRFSGTHEEFLNSLPASAEVEQ